ncbi:MAG: hypothetical protein L3V56_02760 [Candidatus Magnetoovum sp. WYHC-5]|nr:hypothetical protein [Candidatus Magnetoovum sp. WYHC-5]
MDEFEKKTGVTKKELFDLINDAGTWIVSKKTNNFLKADIIKYKKDIIHIQDRMETVKRRIGELNEFGKTVSVEFDNAKKELTEVKLERQRVEEEFRRVEQLDIIASELDEIKKEYDNVCIVYNVSVTKERKNQEELENLLALKEWYDGERRAIEREIESIVGEIFILEDKKTEIAKVIPDYTTAESLKIKETQAQAELDGYETLINDITAKMVTLDEEVAELSVEDERLADEDDRLNRQKEELTQKITELELYENEDMVRAEIEDLKITQQRLSELIKEKTIAIEGNTASLTEIDKQIAEELHFKQMFDQKEQSIKDKRHQLDTINKEINTFSDGIKLDGKVLEMVTAIRSYVLSVNNTLNSEIAEYEHMVKDFLTTVTAEL